MAFLDENGLSHFKDKYDERVESNLNNVIASEYSDTRTSTITAGTYVMKDGNLYRAKQDIPTSETWTAAHWEQVKLANDVGDLKTASYSEDNLNYAFTKTDMESGYWAYSTKSKNSKRLRNSELKPVKKGTLIRYTNLAQSVYFGVLETTTSNTYLQVTGWISAGGSGEVFIKYDGYMTFMVEDTSDITVDDFNVSVKLYIPPTQKDLEKSRDELKSVLFDQQVFEDWESGTYNPPNGDPSSFSARIRLTKFVGVFNNITSAYALDDYEFAVYAWNASTGDYVGLLMRDGTFNTSGTAKWLTNFSFASYPAYKFKIVLRSATSPSSDISTSAATNCIFNVYKFDTDETLTKEHKAADAKATGDLISEVQSELQDALTGLTDEEKLFNASIPGTVETVTFGSDGKPSSVTHTANSVAVRTDVFAWTASTVTETRTLANGKYVTLATDLATLITTISDIQEAA